MAIFDVQTHIDFYEMLVDDFDDFMREQHSARRAFHCILEAYHLREWVWHDLIEYNERLKTSIGVTDERSFNAFVNRQCLWFPYMRELTNGSKHFAESGQSFEAYRVAAAPFSLDVLGAGLDQGAWSGPVRYVSGSLPVGPENKGYLMFDFGEEAGQHRYIPVLHVVECVVRFWRDTLKALHPGSAIKTSSHHVD